MAGEALLEGALDPLFEDVHARARRRADLGAGT
jgi:hypothetical protein